MPRSATKTRERILDAAYRLFRRRGYSRVTMDDIAAEARLTKRTLYHHFESKDQLLAAVLEAQHVLAVAAFRTFGDRLSGCIEEMRQHLAYLRVFAINIKITSGGSVTIKASGTLTLKGSSLKAN